MVITDMHTPRKAGRIVVFIIMKIWALILASLDACARELKRNFSRFEALPGRVMGLWYCEEQAELAEVLPKGFRFGLICRPGRDLGPNFEQRISARLDSPVPDFIVSNLEALKPLLEAYERQSRGCSEGVVIICPSAMSSKLEQTRFLGLDSFRIQQEALVKAYKDLKIIGQSLSLEIIVIEHAELLGNKNSALFERLFFKT